MTSMTGASFYITGGTLRQDAPCYVERQADRDLYEGLRRGEYGYVLHARQMGKSSLMVHTTARLRAERVAVAAFELTALGQNVTVDQWYDGLLSRIGRELDLEEECEEYWLAHERLAPLQRFMGALREEVLPKLPGRIVICLDEIDAVRSLPFSTDEFFAALRECYNRRSRDPEFERLIFCLLGVATPSDLIQDTRTTPFNIGRRIELTDFTETEAAPLAAGLGPDRRAATEMLQRILHWTGGHPYLTQRLCQAVAKEKPLTDVAGVDRLCAALFLTHRARERDDNLLFVRDRLLRGGSDVAGLLSLYARVRSPRQQVADDETNPLVSQLHLSGIVREEDGVLKVRNRIYARVFDRAWVEANMPDAELRRLRAMAREEARKRRYAEEQRREAELQRQRAEERELMARRYLYVAQMNLAQQNWEEGNVTRARELLETWRPRPGQEDLRGFEWRLLWRLCQETALFTFPRRTQALTCVAYSPDGHTLASSSDTTIQIWDVRAKDQHPPGGWVTSLRGHSSLVNHVAFSPNGRILASSSDDQTVRLWDFAARKEVATLQGHRGQVRATAFSPDGRTLASASADRTIRLWDATTRKATAELKVDSPAINAVVFAPDGRALASGQADGRVQLWDLAARRVTTTFRGHVDAVNAVAFSPDGLYLASASGDGTVKLWDLAWKREVGTFWGHRAAVNCLAFALGGQTLVTGSADHTVRLWNLTTQQEITALMGHANGVNSVVFSPDGKTIASGSLDRTIKLWDLDAKDDTVVILQPTEAPRQRRSPASALALSPDGKTLATAHDGTVELWSVVPPAHRSHMTGGGGSGDSGRTPGSRPVAALQAHKSDIVSLAFSPDGKTLATGSVDQTVKLWDVASQERLVTLTGFSPDRYGLAFAPDGRLLARRSGGEVKLWDLANRQAITPLKTSTQPPLGPLGVVFSPDGRFLATNQSVKVMLWDVATWRVAATLRGRIGPPPVFSPDGKTLACDWSNSESGVVTLWDLDARRVMATLRGHASGSGDLAFSPDGKTLAVTSANAIVLYHLQVRQPVATLEGHSGPVTEVAFSGDGNTLVSAAADGTVRLWHAATWQEADRLEVVASGADRKVRLEWSHSSAPAYNVYRGPIGTGRAELARLNSQPVRGSDFVDQSPDLVNGRAYTYAVAGVFPDADGETVEGRSVRVPATPVASPPGFWGCSINEGGNTGSARFDPESGQLITYGSGWDIWEDTDGFYFLSQPVTDDFQITVEALDRPTGSYEWAQAGLMVRETLDVGARTLCLFTTARNGLHLKWRPTANEGPDWEDVIEHARLKLPILLRITRQGNRITPTYSRDSGKTFQPAGDPVLFVPGMAKTLYAGLAITSHDPTEISEARYRNLVIRKL